MEDQAHISSLVKALHAPKSSRSFHDIDIIRQYIVNHALQNVYQFRPDALSKISSSASIEVFEQNKLIYEQDDIGERLYIVLSGTIGIYFPLDYNQTYEDAKIGIADEIFKYGIGDYKKLLRFVKKVEKDSWFGEIGLLNHGKMCSVAICETQAYLMTIEQKDYQALFFEKEQNILYKKLKIFTHNMFSDCKSSSQRILYYLSSKVNTPQSQFLTNEHDLVKDVYIIKKGSYGVKTKRIQHKSINLFVLYQIYKTIFDEETMQEHLSNPYEMSSFKGENQIIRHKSKYNKKYSKIMKLKIIEKNDIVGETDVIIRRAASYSCKCESLGGGTAISIPSEVFSLILMEDTTFSHSIRGVIKTKIQEFNDRVHSISIQMQKFGEFFFFKERKQQQIEQEQQMSSLKDRLSAYNKQNGEQMSYEASKLAMELSQNMKEHQQDENKNYHDFSYFPINKLKESANFERTIPLSSKDFEVDPSRSFQFQCSSSFRSHKSKSPSLDSHPYFSSLYGDKNVPNQKKQIEKSEYGKQYQQELIDNTNGSLNQIEQTENMISHSVSKDNITDKQVLPTKAQQSEAKEAHLSLLYEQTKWENEIYPFGILPEVKQDEFISSTSLHQAQQKSQAEIGEGTPSTSRKSYLNLQVRSQKYIRQKSLLFIGDLIGEKSKSSMQNIQDKNPKELEIDGRVEEEKSQSSSRTVSISPHEEEFSQKHLSKKSLDSNLWIKNHSEGFMNKTDGYETPACTLKNSRTGKSLCFQPQSHSFNYEKKTKLENTKLNFNNNIFSMKDQEKPLLEGTIKRKAQIRDKFLQKAIQGTEAMKQEIMKEKDIVGIADFSQNSKELKSILQIKNLQKKMNEKQDPTKYDHKIKLQQIRVLDMNIQLRYQRDYKIIQEEKRMEEMRFNNITEEQKQKLIRIHLDKIGQQFSEPSEAITSRSVGEREKEEGFISRDVSNKNMKESKGSKGSSAIKHERDESLRNSQEGSLKDEHQQSQQPKSQNASEDALKLENDDENKARKQKSHSEITFENVSNIPSFHINTSYSDMDFRRKVSEVMRQSTNLSPKTIQRFRSQQRLSHSPFKIEADTFKNEQNQMSGKVSQSQTHKNSSFFNYNSFTMADNYERAHQTNGENFFPSATFINTHQQNQKSITEIGPIPLQKNPSSNKHKKIHFKSSVDEYLQMKAQALSTNYDKKKIRTQDLPFLDSYANQLQINLKRLFYVKLQEKYGQEDSLKNMQERIADQMLDKNFKMFLKKNKDIMPEKKNLNYLYNWRDNVELQQQQHQHQLQILQKKQQQSQKQDFLKDNIPTQGFSFKQSRLPQLFENHKIEKIESSLNAQSSIQNLQQDKSAPSFASSKFLQTENNFQSKLHLRHYLNRSSNKSSVHSILQTQHHNTCSHLHDSVDFSNQSINQTPENVNNSRNDFLQERARQFTQNMQQLSFKRKTQMENTKKNLSKIVKNSNMSTTQSSSMKQKDQDQMLSNLEYKNFKEIYQDEQDTLSHQQEIVKKQLVNLNTMFQSNKKVEKALEIDKQVSNDAFTNHHPLPQKIEEKKESKLTLLDFKTKQKRRNFPSQIEAKEAKRGLTVEQEMKELTHSIILKYGLQAKFKKSYFK